MVTTPFRITPSLGPELHQAETQFYWDGVTDPNGTGAPSYQLGSKVIGNDGHAYVFVRNGATPLDADDRVNITESTWAAAANATGTHQAPVDVPANAYFHARQFTL